ncbi:MAG: glycogen debranching protein [Gemmatimonadetes bacterium]|nr:glycogen debranching protein [Gemmatimonadota bacterium]
MATLRATPRVAPSVGLLLAAVFGARVASAQAFDVSPTGVTQGRFAARALHPDTIVSTYPRAAREVRFKFAIAGRDNEFAPGTEHTIYLRSVLGRVETPTYRFGVPPVPRLPRPDDAPEGEDGPASVTLRLDLRAARRALADEGRYVTPLGDTVTSLEPVFVIGDTEPLVWDVRALRPGAAQQLHDPDGDGIYEVTLPFRTEYTRPRAPGGGAVWARSVALDGWPTLSADPLWTALWRLSLEELTQLVRPDGALSAGAKWPGVWTRDVALSSLLSLALVAPDAVRRSLEAKVDTSGRIIQDTGTGGSWPISSDRMTWALAAWELYGATGDRAWLRRAHDVLRRSVQADRHAVLDATDGLMHGETSFLDWREQSYARWLEPADIYQSKALGTNAVHHGALGILARMARELGEPQADAWAAAAEALGVAMRRAFEAGGGRLGAYRTGRLAMSLDDRRDALGIALAVLVGPYAAGARAAAARELPWAWPGVATLDRRVADVPYYHNGTTWPFVTAFATWAAAEAGHEAGVRTGLAALARAPALFLTNKENLVLETGHFEGTALNSDRQLWSVAGTLAAMLRVTFGVRLDGDRLRFRPAIPRGDTATRVLRGLRWRGATLDLTVRGPGHGVARLWLDDVLQPAAELRDTLTGPHRVRIELRPWPAPPAPVVLLDASVDALPTPQVSWREGRLAWHPVPGATRYRLRRDGAPVARTTDTTWTAPVGDGAHEWQVVAESDRRPASYASAPVVVVAPTDEWWVEPEGPLEREGAGHTGDGWARLDAEPRSVRVTVPSSGWYAVAARYANGHGPVNTEDKAAIRTLRVDGRVAGVLVLPQRGSGAWQSWGMSNVRRMYLARGTHALVLERGPLDRNMHGRINEARLDALRVTRLARPSASGPSPRPTR